LENRQVISKSENQQITESKAPSFKVWLLLILLASIWGTSFILVKKSLVVYSSLQVGSIRILAAFLFFTPVLIYKRKEYKLEKAIYFALSGFLGVFFPAYIFAIAGKEMPSAISGALNSLTPLFTLIVGSLFFARKIKSLQIYGIILGFIGSLFLIFTNVTEHLTFNSYGFLILLATVMYGFNLNIVKNNLNEVPAIIVTSGLLAIIGPIAGIILFSTNFIEVTQKSTSILPLFYAVSLGVFSTGLATVLFNKVLQITSPVFASSVTYLIPIFAFIWGILDAETITMQHFTGMGIILVGVYLVNKSS
jgi:drug/metabolite transporter (DMT)-like permease